MSRSNPGAPSSWVPSRVEGEPIWYSDDGSFVLMRRDSWERLHIRLLVPPQVDLPRPLDDVGYAPTPGPAESTDEAPTVVQQHGWGPAEPAEVSDAVFSGGQQHGRPVVTQRIVTTSPDADLPAAQHRRINIGLLTITGILLALAAGVTIGTEMSARMSAQEAPPAAVATPAPGAVATPPAPATPAAPAVTPPPAATAPAVSPAAPPAVTTPTPAAPPTAAPAAPPPAAPAAPAASAPRTPPPAPAAARPATPPPAPQPAPAGVWGAPPPPPAPKPAATVDQGWELVERDARGAAEVFRSVLAARPADPEAHYGLGYALLKQGDRSGATTHLCRARAGSASTQREVTGLLSSNNLSCD